MSKTIKTNLRGEILRRGFQKKLFFGHYGNDTFYGWIKLFNSHTFKGICPGGCHYVFKPKK